MAASGEQASAEAWCARLERDEGNGAAWAELAARPLVERAAVVRALKARVDTLVRNQPPAARPVAEALLRAADTTDDVALGAIAHRGMATAAHFNGDEETARVHFEEAVRLHELAGEPVAAATALRSLVDVHQMAGRPDAALDCASRAAGVFVREGEHRLLAQLRLNVGNVHTRLDDYPAARAHYLSARDAFETLSDTTGVAFADFNLAVVEMNAHRLDAAERAWHAARDGMARAGMGLLVADCDYNLAYLESRRGRYERAIEGLERARCAYDENGKPSGAPLCDLDLAEIHLRLGDAQEARRLARRALARFESLGLAYEEARSRILEATASSRLGDARTAARALARAEERFAEQGNASYAAFTAIQRALVALELGDRSPLAALTASRHTLDERGMPWLAAVAGLALARGHLAAGAPAPALAELRRLRHRPGLDPLLRGLACRLAAEAHDARGRPRAALVAWRLAVVAIDESYGHVPAGDARLAFLADQHPAFVDLALALTRAGRPTEALVTLEHGKARSLRETSVFAPGDAWGRARERLDWLLARRLDCQLGQPVHHELRHGGATTDWDRLVAATRDELSELQRRRRGSSSVERVRPEDLRAACGPGEVLVEYLVGPRGCVAYVVRPPEPDGTAPPRVEAHALEAREDDLRALRERLLFRLRCARTGDTRAEAALRELLDTLGRILLEPVAASVPDGTPLVVVPHGLLHDLPFHALRLDGEPLVAHHDVSACPSALHLARTRSRTPARRRGVDGAADASAVPAPGHPAAGDAPAEDRAPPLGWATGVGLDALPWVEREIRLLAERIGDGLRVVSPDALLMKLTGRELRGTLLHVAGHGHFESEHAGFSAICLGERFLLAHDLAAMRLDLDLVTLSGCETGRTAPVGAGETLGLTQSLLGAGARAVLASLWPVADAEAYRFMDIFYDALASGRTARGSVAAAQRTLLRDDPATTSWAGFGLVGDPDVKLPGRSAEQATSPDPPAEDTP